MIKTFIFVEDGSVDLDELKSSVGDSEPNYSRVYCLYHNERECEIKISEPKWVQKEAFRFVLRPKEQIIFFNDYYDLSLSKNELRNRAKEYATKWHKEACERVEKTQNLLRRLGIS